MTTETSASPPVSAPRREYETRLQQEKFWKERALRSEARTRSANLERDRLVACLARIFTESHLVEIEPAPNEANNYAPAILHYCCIHLPDGRTLTWLIHANHLMYFSGIPYAASDYDGSTLTQKYLALEEVSLSTILEGLTLQALMRAIA